MMADRDRHGLREQKIFLDFAKACGLAIQLDSIEKRAPPEPDILCQIEREGAVAFEMVELIDQGLAQQTNESIRFQQLLEDSYQYLPTNARTAIEGCFKNALVHVTFHTETSSRERENAIPRILDWLQGFSPSFIGRTHPEERSALHKVVSEITVSRGDFSGPFFDVDAGGAFADPALERIGKKFEKKYVSTTPVELLAYYELQPVLSEELWLPQLRAFITRHIGSSGFRRVWVYDIKSKEVKLEWGQ
jgi:hypothetical protein